MKEESKYNYAKLTQKDYPMSFKLSVVDEFERGGLCPGDHKESAISG
jgi:hypothetical protein